jgi:hypothetical protein
MSVLSRLTKDGYKMERKWGGFKVEGDDRVFMPLDFLASVVSIKSKELNVDEIVSSKTV